MGALIDSSVFVEAERGRLDLGAWLEKRSGESFAISAVTLSELWHGVHRAASGRRRAAREAFVRSVFDDFPVLPFDAKAAEVHARLWAQLAARGTLLGAHDLLIAATAVAADMGIVTLNLREFRRVPGLRVYDPLSGAD